MGLTAWVAARAVRSAHVLVVECPGAWEARVAAERAVVHRGWRLAQSPASADVLLVVGAPGEELAGVVQRLWDAMPGPRARVDVGRPQDASPALDAAALHLVDDAAQGEDAGSRAAATGCGMDHGDMNHGDMGDMDHGDMDMAPDGIPLAEGSNDDRDGLEMDALPVRLGPVLPAWPAGLVLDVTLHGDLVADARARLLDGAGEAPAAEGHPAARACDDAAAMLDLAGWPSGATRARVARDAFLDGRAAEADAALTDLRRRVTASRVLGWSLRGVGSLDDVRVRELGLPEHLAGDCLDRLVGLLEGGGTAPAHPPEPVPVTALGPLATGHDLAVARLIVASVGSALTSSEVAARG